MEAATLIAGLVGAAALVGSVLFLARQTREAAHQSLASRSSIGSALIQFGLEHARESGVSLVLETGTLRNVSLYERLGFHVAEEDDAPEGGPHVWFMRCNP